jgi:post-segregation antitoxin (ccd killing protein)
MEIELKKNVMIRIDQNLVQKAKALGLNISKVSENALKEMIARIERPISPKELEDWPESGAGGAARIRTGVPSARGSEPRPC